MRHAQMSYERALATTSHLTRLKKYCIILLRLNSSFSLQKAKSQSQLNTSGVTLNADIEPKTHHHSPMTDGYSYFIHFKTVETEVEIQVYVHYVSIFVATV